MEPQALATNIDSLFVENAKKLNDFLNLCNNGEPEWQEKNFTEYQCGVCKCYLTRPYLTSCGCTLHIECAGEIGKQCPLCTRELKWVATDIRHQREFLSCRTKCPRSKFGCQFVDSVSGVILHKCEYIPKSCRYSWANCKFECISQEELDQHEKDYVVHWENVVESHERCYYALKEAQSDDRHPEPQELLRIPDMACFATESNTYVPVPPVTCNFHPKRKSFCVTCSISGHYIDVAGSNVYFRLRFTDSKGNIHWFPNEAGSKKYLYVEHCRLEQFTLNGVCSLPSIDDYTIQLEVRVDVGAYRILPVNYGEVVLFVSY